MCHFFFGHGYSYQRWESVRVLRQSAGFPSIYDIFSRRSEAFLNVNLQITNQVPYFYHLSPPLQLTPPPSFCSSEH